MSEKDSVTVSTTGSPMTGYDWSWLDSRLDSFMTSSVRG